MAIPAGEVNAGLTAARPPFGAEAGRAAGDLNGMFG